MGWFFLTTAQKMKFSIKDFLSKFEQFLGFLRIWSHLLKKPLMENLNLKFILKFIFCPVNHFNVVFSVLHSKILSILLFSSDRNENRAHRLLVRK